MARTIKRLSARDASHAKPPKGRNSYLLADGGCLYVQASRSAEEPSHIRRSWLFSYQLHGQRHGVGLGSLDTISLAEARDKARQLRQRLLDGIDPLQHKAEQDKQRRLESAKAMSFSQCVDEYLKSHDIQWKNSKHRDQWRSTLTTYCKPIADLPVKSVDTDLILRCLSGLWATKTETASRLRGRIERVLSWAKGRGLRSGENPARWQGHLSEMLPSPILLKKRNGSRHHPALPYREIPQFMAELRKRDSLSARALEFTVLTAARTSETLGATWDEIDFEQALWIVPKERMKSDREHRVPLSGRTLEILKERYAHRHGDHVFALSNMALLQLLKGMEKWAGITTHGFRSSFRDWAGDVSHHPREVIEAALAHTVGDAAEQAYRRSDALMKRRKLMDSWSSYCSKPPVEKGGAKVISMGAKR